MNLEEVVNSIEPVDQQILGALETVYVLFGSAVGL